MANLMLTTACNFSCDYCFGKEMIGKGHPQQTMKLPLFREILEWFERGKEDNKDIHLMGGEPTISPYFSDILAELGNRSIPYVIFSNFAADLDRNVLEKTMRHDARWVVNANEPAFYTDNQLKRLHQHLAIAGSCATLTLNITSPATKFQYIFDYIDHFRLARNIKIGVALPTLDHRNVHVKREDFPEVGAHVMKLVHEAYSRHIDIEFECGVAYCLFDEEQRRQFDKIKISHCGSRLDITPTGKLINCLPLCSIAAIPFNCFPSYKDALTWFRAALLPYRSLGAEKECLTCRYISDGTCQACLANTLWKLNRIVLPPLPVDGENLDCTKPAIIQGEMND